MFNRMIMSEIIKICKRHGELPNELIRIQDNGRWKVKVCILCCRETAKKSREKNPEKEKLRRKLDYLKNRERNLAYRKEYLSRPEAKQKRDNTRIAYGIKHKDRLKDKNLRFKFNITLEQYNQLLHSQNYVCAICYQPEKALARGKRTIKSLAVDHCHKTGKIRGLLCDICNKGIGHFEDSINKLESAILYLKKYTDYTKFKRSKSL
jgi:hypothetical protein